MGTSLPCHDEREEKTRVRHMLDYSSVNEKKGDGWFPVLLGPYSTHCTLFEK